MNWLNFHWGPQILIAVGAILTIAGGFWAVYQSNAQNSELTTLAKENARLASEISAYTTGGDSIALLQFAYGGPEKRYILASVEGKYPLRDVVVRTVDVLEFQKNIGSGAPLTLESAFRGNQILKIGNLGVGSAKIVGELSLSDRTELKFNCFFTTLNGHYVELIRGHKVGENWVFAFKAVDEIKGKVLFEKVDPEFPRDQNGEVQWD